MIYQSEKTAKGNIGVSYVSAEKAEEQSKEMDNNGCINCYNCSDCSGCSRCSRCSRCSDCSDCSGCSGCSRCSDCSDCSGCSRCSRCSRCSGCSRCSRCSGCSRCSDCSGCSGCSRCSDCSGCSGCSRCSDCSDCSDCSGCSDCSDCEYFVDNEKITLTPEQQIANLDKVGAIILDDADRLSMGLWHADESWKEKTCAEEAVCGTSHCLAGWLQVCATDPKVRAKEPSIGGAMQAPIAAKMFFRSHEEVKSWLQNRDYVKELGVVESEPQP